MSDSSNSRKNCSRRSIRCACDVRVTFDMVYDDSPCKFRGQSAARGTAWEACAAHGQIVAPKFQQCGNVAPELQGRKPAGGRRGRNCETVAWSGQHVVHQLSGRHRKPTRQLCTSLGASASAAVTRRESARRCVAAALRRPVAQALRDGGC